LTSELGCAEQLVTQYRGGRRTQEATDVRCLGLPTTLSAAQTAVYSARLETPGQEADCWQLTECRGIVIEALHAERRRRADRCMCAMGVGVGRGYIIGSGRVRSLLCATCGCVLWRR